MTAPTVTADEFLAAYAQRAGVPALQLLEAGRVVATCACDYQDCEGWQIIPKDCLQPADEVSITAEEYAKPAPRSESDHPRCQYCGRFIRADNWWECSKGCGGRR